MSLKVRLGMLALAACGPLVLSACGGGGGGLTAEEILANAAEATLALDTVQFAIVREGEPPLVEPNTGAKFISASGFYDSPDTVQATIRAETPFGVQDLGLVLSPESNTMTVPGLGTLDLPAEFDFDPSEAFKEEGLPAVLTEAIVNPTLEGEESFEGVPVYHVSGTASGESLSSLTAGAVAVDDMAIDVYVERETFHVVHMALTEGSGDRWLLDMFAYDEPVVG